MSARATTTTICWSRRRLQLSVRLLVADNSRTKTCGLRRKVGWPEKKRKTNLVWKQTDVVQHWSRGSGTGSGRSLDRSSSSTNQPLQLLVINCSTNNQQQPFNTNLKRYQKYKDGHWTDQRKQNNICAEGFLILNIVFQKIIKIQQCDN